MYSGKSPEPSAKHSEIDAWIETLVPHLQPIVKVLDRSIRAAVPGLHYAVKYKRAFCGRQEHGWIIELAPYDVSVNVLFFGGADFDPPRKIGSADLTRYVKVTNLAEGTPAGAGRLDQTGGPHARLEVTLRRSNIDAPIRPRAVTKRFICARRSGIPAAQTDLARPRPARAPVNVWEQSEHLGAAA